MMQPWVIRFLQRKSACATWIYERRVILFVELLCQLACILVAFTWTTKIVLLANLPFTMLALELARSSRSGAARKAETTAAMGIPAVTLHCEKDLVRDAKRQQMLSGMTPMVGLIISMVSTPNAGMVLPSITACAVSLIRWAMVEDYGRWRTWYRERVPFVMKVPLALVETKPFDSGQMARAVEEALKAKEN